MQDIYEEYHNKGFEILAVNTSYQDIRTEAEDFYQQHHLTYPILFDQTGEVSANYNLNATPTTYFIDKQGVIRNVIFGGPISKSEILSNIKPLLEELD